jgi:DNA-binding response OmpR family regulator
MPKILIAEDERDIRDLVVLSLEFAGFEVVAAANGVEAVQVAAEQKPDLILMDVRMPKMTGYEACKQLRQDKATQDIPVVFLSAKGQETEVKKGLDSGAADYIIKPFAPDELARRVREILKREAGDAHKRKTDDVHKRKADDAQKRKVDDAQKRKADDAHKRKVDDAQKRKADDARKHEAEDARKPDTDKGKPALKQ